MASKGRARASEVVAGADAGFKSRRSICEGCPRSAPLREDPLPPNSVEKSFVFRGLRFRTPSKVNVVNGLARRILRGKELAREQRAGAGTGDREQSSTAFVRPRFYYAETSEIDCKCARIYLLFWLYGSGQHRAVSLIGSDLEQSIICF
jgi:hypothetical protein